MRLETELMDALAQSRVTLGDAIPRLRTRKPQVACNGLIHGLTGQYTFLTDVQLVTYLKKGATYFNEFKPVGILETDLLQRIVDTGWRLSRVPYTEEVLRMSSLSRATQHLKFSYPRAAKEDVEPYADADAFRTDSTDFEKLGRYETRLSRLSLALNKELDRVQSKRIAKAGGQDVFNLEESEACQWYADLLTLATSLVDAREELKHKSEVVEEPTACELDLLGKNRLHIVKPLTKKATKTLEDANYWGLLTDIERTLFLESTAA